MEWSRHMTRIELVYTRYIPGIYWCQPNIKINSLIIPLIYFTYLWYIPGIYFDIGIYLVYTWYIPGLYQCKFFVTRWLVLRRRTGPHSSRASCDDISRPCDYSDFFTARAPTARILAPGHVSVKGALRTENSIYIPFLTSTAYKTILYDGRCINHAVCDNGTDKTVQANVKEWKTAYLSTVN